MDCASSSIFSGLKTWRGCDRFGSISSMPSSSISLSTARAPVGLNRALRPLPRAFFDIVHYLSGYNLFGKFEITFGTLRFNVVEDNRLAMARRFGEADVARHDGCKDL